MKPYITFTLEFKNRVSLNSLQQTLLGICPFDHLQRNIKKIKGKTAYDVQVFLPDVEFLEEIHSQLEKQSKAMELQLNERFTLEDGKVTNIEIGVVT
ncbi:MAG: hypothetical protein ACXAB2_12385 [Candidatus Hodarchaeales archaeon]|jgi:hypothetical protein